MSGARSTTTSGSTTTAPRSRRIKLALVSCGLGNVNRGFEISTARWFDALRAHTDLDVELWCGGDYEGGKKLWNLPRNSAWTAPFRHLPFCSEQRRWELSYGTEQISFWGAMNFELLASRPDVVWVKDVPLAHFFLISRAQFGMKYKVILCNGGMLRPQTYKDFDVIQQMSLEAYRQAEDFGIPTSKMQLISNCCPALVPNQDRQSTRASLGYSDEDFVIISVAAWNKYHKRIDYLIREVAALNDPRARLLLCGAPEVDTDELKQLGAELLGDRIQWVTVAPSAVPDMLNAADVFVLASLRESLGNALLEAVLAGLPVVAHPHDGAKFILLSGRGDASTVSNDWITDLSRAGNLRDRLQHLRLNPPSASALAKLRHDVATRFSDSTLAAQFEKMVEACLKN